MDTTVVIASVLVRISAYSKKHGLLELEKQIADAATAALLEVPGAADIPELRQLAGATIPGRMFR